MIFFIFFTSGISMQSDKNSFITLALKCQALQWGEFTLKSGRISPYFFNMGMFYENEGLLQLGRLYADLIQKNKIEVSHLFGPAYKGIPLATATAIALAERQFPVSVTFNRKEAKDHGEGGLLMGAPLSQAKTIMIDDVMTAGTAFRESKSLIEAAGGQLTAVVIALDRCERGQGPRSALDEIRSQGIQVYSIITFFDLVEYLKNQKKEDLANKLIQYHSQYGTEQA
jgi:orotate phosphoribosyltransferase